MLLRTLPNKKSYSQAIYDVYFSSQLLPSTVKKTFSNDKIFCVFILPSSSQLAQTQRPLKSMKITFIYTINITDFNCTLFIALFLYNRISFCGNKYKRQNKITKASLPWVEFKPFFWKGFGNSNTLVDIIESRNNQYY